MTKEITRRNTMNGTFQKCYVGEDQWEDISEQYCRESLAKYYSPETVEELKKTPGVVVRTPWSFYRYVIRDAK